MPHRGKKYRQAATLVTAGRLYTVDEAVELLETTSTTKFDPSIEIHFNLDIDPKFSDQIVRSTITLPHGNGKAVRIGAFTDTGNEKELLALGATAAGGDDLVDIVAGGTIGFDLAIATPGMMRKMGKIAKILGPKGLMPNPKVGTVGDDLVSILKESLAGKFEFKNDKQGNVHSIVGKLSFGTDKLRENINHFIKTVREAKPASIKGASYINSVALCSTMGPGIRLDIR